jgi:flagellar basal body rod protein FlgG
MENYNMKKYVIFMIMMICPIFIIAQGTDRDLLENEFRELLIDLLHRETIGYKRHLFDNNNYRIDFSQGTLSRTNRIFDFSIIGNGFFKIILTDGRIAYTRAGEFTIDLETNKLKTIDGYFLYDSFIILPGFLSVYIDNDNKLIAVYPNNEIIICGIMKSYELDTIELYKDSMPRRAFDQTIPDFINRTGSLVIGMRINGKNDTAIFFYKGNNENISNSIIVNNHLENSNVDFFEIYRRLMEINILLYNK